MYDFLTTIHIKTIYAICHNSCLIQYMLAISLKSSMICESNLSFPFVTFASKRNKYNVDRNLSSEKRILLWVQGF